MTHWARRHGLLITMAMVLLAAACTSTAAPTPQQGAAAPAVTRPSTYKIGHSIPLSGGEAVRGVPFNQNIQMAVDEVNSQGGVNGVKMELVAEDSLGDPKQGLMAFNKLAQVEKTPIILSIYSSVIMSSAPSADENKTVLFNYGANATTIRGSGKFVFSTYPLADLDIKILAGYVYDQKNARNAAVLYVNNDSGRSSAEVFRDAFQGKGGKVGAYEAHEPGAIDFGAQLAKIKASNPDVIHIPSLTLEFPRILKQARESGIKSLITTYSLAEGQEVLDQAGMAADGVLYTFIAPPETKPEVKDFYDRWQAKYGKLPPASAVSMTGWDTVVHIIPAAIKYADQKGWGYTGEAIRRAITEVKEFDTKVTGKTIFQFPGQDVVKPITLKVINGKEKRFETVTVLEAK